MEAIWFCSHRKYFRTLVLGLAISSRALLAAEETKTAFVDVTVDVVEGDLVKAQAEAEKKSFEIALDLALPETVTGESRDALKSKASTHVKNYQKIGEKLVGNQLTVKYRVEVTLPKFSEPEPQTAIATRFEIALQNRSKPIQSSEIVRFASEQWKLSVSNLRMSRGNIRFDVMLAIPVSEAEAQLSQFIGARGSVRAFDIRPVDQPSDVIPSQIPTGEPQGVESNQLVWPPKSESAVVGNQIQQLPPSQLPSDPTAPSMGIVDNSFGVVGNSMPAQP